ncbi:MAG: phosphoribosylformylglycinamidine cyclo-ligase [Defluviitaleaceae bacterium]|nr:phosphoribosylformylglycinamidine cyclo-ligase [Defluviitaleaceae bacterium]
MPNHYKQAGVDIEAGYEAVSRIKKHVERTKIAGVLGGLGGFGGLFELTKHMAGMEEPVTVSGTDSVGTKVMLAFELDKHDTIGIDAVAMCVNDVITVGAKPLFFLDYIGCGKLDPSQAEAIVSGVCEGCIQAGSALIGGEMAEMPGVYKPGEYDLVGFSVGIIDKKNIITGEKIIAGDVLIGLASSGVHSNGFSLVRKIIADNGLELSKVYPELNTATAGETSQPRTLGEVLLTPTRIYTSAVVNLVDAIEVKGMAHITGGGFIENIPRFLPAGLGATITRGSWDIPAIFGFLQQQGGIDETEMYNLYNMGIGMVAAVSGDNAAKAIEILASQGEKAAVIGRVVPGEGVTLEK